MKRVTTTTGTQNEFFFPPEVIETFSASMIHCPDYKTFIRWHSTCVAFWDRTLDAEYIFAFIRKSKEKNLHLLSVNFRAEFHLNYLVLEEIETVREIVEETKRKFYAALKICVNSGLVHHYGHKSGYVCFEDMKSFFGAKCNAIMVNETTDYQGIGLLAIKEVARHLFFRYGFCIDFRKADEVFYFPFKNLRGNCKCVVSGYSNIDKTAIYLTDEKK